MNNNPNIDYLNKLPIELWREILSAIPLHPALSTSESTDPFLFLDTVCPSCDIFRRVQGHRMELMTVCKTLYPLAEEMLFSRIGLHATYIENNAFERAAMRQMVGSQRRCGEMTTHLWVFDYEHDGKYASCLSSIRTVLPNLRSLEHDSSFSLPIYTMVKENWSLCITVFAVNSCHFRCSDLILLSLCLPQLTTLKLLCAIGGWTDPPQMISFPCLQVLIIDTRVSGALPLHLLHLPLLKWVCVNTIWYQDIDFLEGLLRKVGQTLQGIKILGWISSEGYTTRLHKAIFDNAPNLETFIFDVKSRCSLEVQSIDLHPLKHLMFKESASWQPTAILPWAHNLVSCIVFPSLERITLGFYDIPVGDSLNAVATAMVNIVKYLYPNVQVEGVGIDISRDTWD